MDIASHVINNVVVIDIPKGNSGLINYNVNDLMNHILELKNGKSGKLAFDMSKKIYLNSTGLAELITIKDKLIDEKIELILINPTDRVKSLLNMVGVDRFFHIVDSVAELNS